MKVKYEKISETKRNEIQNELFNTVVDCFRKEKLEDGFYKYEVPLQEIRFVTAMTDEELKDSAQLTIDLMEELKKVILIIAYLIYLIIILQCFVYLYLRMMNIMEILPIISVHSTINFLIWMQIYSHLVV